MSIEQNLSDLWQAFKSSPGQTDNSAPATPKKIQTELRLKEPIHGFRCSIENCLQCCCRNQGQKIRLLLQDLSILLDHGFADMIEGTYDSADTVKAFLDAPSPHNVYRTPYLKRKIGKDGKDECIFLTEKWTCSIWNCAPFICKTYPVVMEQEMTPEKMILSFSLDKRCSCTRDEQLQATQPKENTEKLLNNAIAERLEADHTSKLLCYHREELKKIGLGKYL